MLLLLLIVVVDCCCCCCCWCGGKRSPNSIYNNSRSTAPAAVMLSIFKSLREIAVPQGNPAEWVTEVGCGSRRHPGETRQTPTRSRRNRQKSVAKSYRNLVQKIVKLYEKSYQNLVREGPRSLQNRSGTLPERARAKITQKKRVSISF